MIQIFSSTEASFMLSAPTGITVTSDNCLKCLQEEGDVDCQIKECELCFPCLSNHSLQHFHHAYREHHRRGAMKRIFPTASYNQPKFTKQFNDINILQVKWFSAKCEVDPEWC